MCVFTDYGDRHSAFGFVNPANDLIPSLEIGLRGVESEMPTYFAVEAFGMIGAGHSVNCVEVERRNHPAFPQIAEQRDLLASGGRNRTLAAAQQNVRLDTEPAQLFRGMLGL